MPGPHGRAIRKAVSELQVAAFRICFLKKRLGLLRAEIEIEIKGRLLYLSPSVFFMHCWKLGRYIFGQFGCIKGTHNATELPLLLKREEACSDYNKSAAPAKLANVTAFCERQFSRRQSCPAAASLLRGSSNCVLARFCFSISLLKTSASCSRQCSVKQSVEQNILRGLLGLKSPGTKRFVQFDLKHFLNGWKRNWFIPLRFVSRVTAFRVLPAILAGLKRLSAMAPAGSTWAGADKTPAICGT
jgi:hypothetical protein